MPRWSKNPSEKVLNIRNKYVPIPYVGYTTSNMHRNEKLERKTSRKIYTHAKYIYIYWMVQKQMNQRQKNPSYVSCYRSFGIEWMFFFTFAVDGYRISMVRFGIIFSLYFYNFIDWRKGYTKASKENTMKIRSLIFIFHLVFW